MSELEFRLEGPVFSAKLARLGPETMRRGIKELTRLTYALAEEAKSKFDEAGLHSRTGGLKGSIQAQPPAVEGREIVGRVLAGQKLPYARAQEYGATITPKNAQFLAIPLDAVKTGAGVARFAPRQAEAAGYTSTFVRNGVLFGKQGDQLVPLFALKRSVRLPERSFMRAALVAMQLRIEQGLKSALERTAKE